ncbi:tetratricopeptide repeat protein [Cohaesibacter celericrescens]|uniref:Tetratricopeptide repeat protein n=1 Tax=Cohaesibacter celericrescens TaxID=2067669 RepID=A0A2N5XWK3_9HYPH|nr:hypothetical protein [Cohaesibacter celericrescens]PLW78837.1 hypothetical protein C0081_00925 [Cohaesibacter celericrescens]
MSIPAQRSKLTQRGSQSRAVDVVCRAMILMLFTAALIFASGMTGSQVVHAQQSPADVGELIISPSQENGFGRVVLNFSGRNLLPGYSIKQDNSIFVIRFDERMKSGAVTALSRALSDYISIARLDPDGKGIRIALKENVRVNTMEAGERLFIDLLPRNWAGLPPSLPSEVVTELANRAEEALRRARSLEQASKATRIQPKLDIRIGDHPTFSRFAFVWNIPFDSTFEREGKQVNLFFNHATNVDLSEIRASLPSLVQDMRMIMENGRAKFTLEVAKNADVRAFREDNAYIVDITGDKDLFAAKSVEDHITRAVSKPGDTGVLVARGVDLIAADGSLLPQTNIDGVGERIGGSSKETRLIIGPGPNKPDENASLFTNAQVTKPIVPTQVTGQTTSQAPTQQQTPAMGMPQPKPEAKVETPLPVVNEVIPAADTVLVTSAVQDVLQPAPAPEFTPAPAPERGNAERMNGTGEDLSSQALHVEAKTFGRSVRLYFPFKNPTASAVFRKNGVIWAVFDTTLDLDVTGAKQYLASMADDLEVWRSGNIAVLRVPLKNSRLVTFSPEGYGWLLTIGDLVVEPTKPLHMVRTKISGGRTAMRVKFDTVGSLLQLRDPETGETLHVVTGLGPARGFVKAQRFVDFSTLISAHGIAVSQHVDDLQVARDEGFVYISSVSGLSLSNSEVSKIDVSSLTSNQGKTRETFLDLDKSVAKTPVIFIRQRQELERKLSKLDDLMAIQSQMALAKLLVANGYAFEALGHLQMIEQSAPEFARGKEFRTLFSAAEVFAGRPDSAYRRLNHPEFLNDPDASVWRGLAAARSGRWREAEDALDLASTVASDYGNKVRQMLLLDGVEISLLDQQFDRGSAALAEINPTYLDKEGIARFNLLRGKIAVARNQPKEAFESFNAARETKYLPIANDAWLQDIKLRQQENVIDVDEAIDELESLTAIWRGDDVELNALRSLAHFYVDKGAFRSAFETLKSTASSNPNSDISRVLQEEMNAVFSSLFLDGEVKGLSAIKALSLYYDFRELTPVGRRGDEMVRRLADKLVEVDLLDRAADLLKHQVENRLKGAARSQIAADLALIYLLDSKPNLALDTLRRTRQSQLPLSLERQRRLVEAKALAELNKVSLALDLLKPLEGEDIDQLRADIMWRAKRWQDAAEQIELMLGERWSSANSLDQGEQTNILRAGIAYSLADDKLGLDRLRRKYAERMSNTSVSGAFDVVTLPIQRDGQEFQAIAQEIAGIDTMERFLKEYRARYLNTGNSSDNADAVTNADPAGLAPKSDAPTTPQV